MGAGIIMSEEYSANQSQIINDKTQQRESMMSRTGGVNEKLGTIIATHTMSTIDKGSFKQQTAAGDNNAIQSSP